MGGALELGDLGLKVFPRHSTPGDRGLRCLEESAAAGERSAGMRGKDTGEARVPACGGLGPHLVTALSRTVVWVGKCAREECGITF